MTLDKDKPYVLRVAELIYSSVVNIKKENPNVKFYYYAKDNKEKMVLAPDWTNTLKMIIPT